MGVLEFMQATRKVLRLLASEPEAVGARTGVAATRLTAGWTAMTFEREVLWSG